MDSPQKIKNFDLWKDVQVPNIDVHIKSWKTLKQLKKHGVNMHTFTATSNIFDSLYTTLLNNEVEGINLIKSYFERKKYILNINFYYQIIRYLFWQYSTEPDNAFIGDYFSIYNKILSKMIKLHQKECQQAIRYIKCKKIRHLNIQIKDKHGKQSNKNKCSLCQRQIWLTMLIGRRNNVWSGLSSSNNVPNYAWGSVVPTGGTSVEGFEHGPCPLHKDIVSLQLKKYNRGNIVKYNNSRWITVSLYNHCVLQDSYEGISTLFWTTNYLTNSWLLNGDFLKIFDIGIKFFNLLFDQRVGTTISKPYFGNSIDPCRLQFTKKFIMCLQDFNNYKLLSLFWKKFEYCLGLEQIWIKMYDDEPNQNENDYCSCYTCSLRQQHKREVVRSVCHSVVRMNQLRGLTFVSKRNQKQYDNASKWLYHLSDYPTNACEQASLPLTNYYQFPNAADSIHINTNVDIIDKYSERFSVRFSRIFRLFKNVSINHDVHVKNVILENYDQIYDLLFDYSMYLFKHNSKYATKYFQFCIKLRPLNGYLHFQYSLYLCKILKNYRNAMFHLKLSHMLNRHLYVLKKNNFYQKYLRYLQRKLPHLCDYIYCNNKRIGGKTLLLVKTSNINLNHQSGRWSVCSGCKSVYYCNAKCQRLDWSLKHKYQCIKQYLKPLSRFDSIMAQRMQFMLSQWAVDINTEK